MTALTFGPFIERARLARGLTQDGLGSLAGCSRTYLSNLEGDHGVPSPSLLVRLSKHLEVDLGALTRLAGALQDRISSSSAGAAS